MSDTAQTDVAALVEKARAIPIGARFRLTTLDPLDGKTRHFARCTKVGDVKQHGYWVPGGGGWALYGGDGDTPCYYVPVRMYRKRLTRALALGEGVLDIREGW